MADDFFGSGEMGNSGSQSFRSLEIATGWSFSNTSHSPLENWYEKNRDIPLEKLTHFDLARCCRQSQFLDHIVPICVKRLEESLSSDEQPVDELIMAMNHIPQRFWREKKELAKSVSRIIPRMNREDLTEGDRDEVDDLLYSVTHID